MSDISRDTFDPRKHYTGVVMQQGRVLLDTDWNEQQAIHQYHVGVQTQDVLGQCAVPQMGGGFKIGFTPDYSDLTISSGRMYIEGMLCELEEATPVRAKFLNEGQLQVQDWCVDGQLFRRGQWIELLDERMQPQKLFRILETDADQQILTLRIDKEHYDPTVLCQQDTLYLRRVTTYLTQPHYPTTEHDTLKPAFATYPEAQDLPTLSLHEDHFLLIVYLDVWKRSITSLDDPRIREVALGGPDTTTREQVIWQVKILPIELKDELREAREKHRDLTHQQETQNNQAQLEQQIAVFSSTLTCNTSFNEWDQLIAPHTGKMNVRTRPPALPGNPGYQKRENQLYRVEIHNGGDADGNLTFKWAYDNASVLSTIKSIDGQKVTVQSLGHDDIQGFVAGKWAELTSETTEVNGLPGSLVRIKDVDPITKTLTVEQSLPATQASHYTKIRRWDERVIVKGDEHDWLDLDSGIQVQFSPSSYRYGDFWLIPARNATGEVEWPPYQLPNQYPIPQRPRGGHHHYARLARVLLAKTIGVQDCRCHFAPLASQAIHVLGINWRNDGHYSRELLKQGLHITLDADPDPLSVSSASLILSVEPTLPGNGESTFIMNGHIEVEANNIYWRWGEDEEDEEGGVAELLDKLSIFFRNRRHRPRVRVTLKGHYIWSTVNNQMLYLDGQTFGFPGVQDDRQSLRLGLAFPSGTGARASNFESWFYLTEL